MRLSFIVDSKPLMAAKHFVSNDPLRFPLNGVLAEIEEAKVTFVATNGRILFACQASIDGMTGFEGKTQVVIPPSLLRYAKPKKADPSVWLRIEDGDVTLSIGSVSGPRFTDKAIDDYPKWRQCLGKGDFHPAANICINPELIAPFLAAINELRPNTEHPPSVHFWADGGDGTSPLHLLPSGIGGEYEPIMVMMPMWRDEDLKALKVPEWAKQTETEEAK